MRLNRRLCDVVYLGVVPITLGPDGRHMFGGDGEAVEYAMQVRRIRDDETMLSWLQAGRDRRLAASSSRAQDRSRCGRTAPVRQTHGTSTSGNVIVSNRSRSPKPRHSWCSTPHVRWTSSSMKHAAPLPVSGRPFGLAQNSGWHYAYASPSSMLRTSIERWTHGTVGSKDREFRAPRCVT